MQFAGNSYGQGKYGNYAQLTRKLTDEFGDKVGVVTIEDNVQFEQFFNETVGVQLPYALVTNRDPMNQGDERGMRSTLMQVSPGGAATLVAGPDGKIAFRAEDSLSNAIGPIRELIRARAGTLKPAPAKAKKD